MSRSTVEFAGALPLHTRREEFWGVSRSAERCVQIVHERRRDELTTQKNRAYWPAPSGRACIPSLSEESGAATLTAAVELFEATAWAGALLQLITHTS